MSPQASCDPFTFLRLLGAVIGGIRPPFQYCLFESYHPELQNVTVFGVKVYKEVDELEWGYKDGPIPVWLASA